MNRRQTIAIVVLALGTITAAILIEVFATILFAITVAYVLLPVHRWLMRRGLPQWWSAVLTTLFGFTAAMAIFSPIAAALYWRRDDLVALVRSLPAEVSVELYDQELTVSMAELQSLAIDALRDLALSIATAAPELAVKAALFVILLFALLLKWQAASRAALAPVPHEHRDVAIALSDRAKETLWAIYVLQLGTSVATLLIGYPLFLALGYESPFALAMIAAILQFVPIIGPSLLIVPIAVYHLFVGELLAAVLVLVLGVALVAWLPDVWVRPRLARETAGMPGSLYFVGFTGGLFTLGPIGIVVGPLIVSVFAEAVALLAEEVEANDLALARAELEAQGETGIDEAPGGTTPTVGESGDG